MCSLTIVHCVVWKLSRFCNYSSVTNRKDNWKIKNISVLLTSCFKLSTEVILPRFFAVVQAQFLVATELSINIKTNLNIFLLFWRVLLKLTLTSFHNSQLRFNMFINAKKAKIEVCLLQRSKMENISEQISHIFSVKV